MSETSHSSLKNSGASAEFQQASLCEAAAADPAPRDTAALRDSVLRFRVAGKEKYSTATDETGGGVAVEWERRQIAVRGRAGSNLPPASTRRTTEWPREIFPARSSEPNTRRRRGRTRRKPFAASNRASGRRRWVLRRDLPKAWRLPTNLRKHRLRKRPKPEPRSRGIILEVVGAS